MDNVLKITLEMPDGTKEILEGEDLVIGVHNKDNTVLRTTSIGNDAICNVMVDVLKENILERLRKGVK